MTPISSPRPGFTLLEIVLALGISLSVLILVYQFLDINNQYVKTGRELVQEGTLARSILTRVAADVQGQIAPIDPRAYSSASDPSDSSGLPGLSGITGTNFNLGVRGGAAGDLSYLILSQSRLRNPRMNSTQGPAGDLRQVIYWFVEGKGLARQEVLQVTSQEAENALLLEANPDDYLIAPEVKSFRVEFFDGTAWQDSWDGGMLAEDNETPIGPPLAVAVVLTLRRPGSEISSPEYRQVVAIPVANKPTELPTDP